MMIPSICNLLFVASALAAPPQAEVHSQRDGKTKAFVGNVIELDEKQIVLETPNGRVTIKQSGLRSIKPKSSGVVQARAQEAAVWIELVDTSVLAAGQFAIDKRAARAMLAGKVADLAKRDIQSVRFHSQDGDVAKLWKKFRQRDVVADQIVIRVGDHKIDAIEGVVRRVDDKVVTFELDGDEVPVPLAKVYGIIYYQIKGRKLGEPQGTIHLVDGSRVVAQEFKLHKGRIQIATTAGVRFDWPWDRIEQFEFSSSDAIYLSDLQAESSKWTPFLSSNKPSPELEEMFAPSRDQAIFGGKLRLPSAKSTNGKYAEYDKGLALHSRTQIIYRLPTGFKSFQAIVGIDSRLRPAGNVRLTILADKKQLYDEKISGADAPIELNLDIRGAARLSILVDFGEDLDVADHLNLCQARIAK